MSAEPTQKKTRVRQVFGRQRLEAGDKVYVFEMSKSGVSVCATGRGQVESSKTFPELLAFIAGVEINLAVNPVISSADSVEYIDKIIQEARDVIQKNTSQIEFLNRENDIQRDLLRTLGSKRSEKQTLQLV